MSRVDLSKLRQDFDSPSPTIRRAAIDTLAELENPDAVEELVSAREHLNLDVCVRKPLVGILTLLLCMIGCVSVEKSPGGAISNSALELAQSGEINTNPDWQPVIQEFNGIDMALVPAGCFQMGSTDEQVAEAIQVCKQEDENCIDTGFSIEQPVHTVCFSEPFWIDVYEVTNEQYGEASRDPLCNELSSEPDQPRTCLSWFEAREYCQSRGARLPTEAEWEYAARGPDGLIYPWGNVFDSKYVAYYSMESLEETSPLDYDYEPVGSKPDGASWVGAQDMSGNAWEWIDGWRENYSDTPIIDPLLSQEEGFLRVLRGGGFPYTYGLRSAFRYGDLPISETESVRCVQDFADELD